MSNKDLAIKVDKISKVYSINHQQAQYSTFRDSVVNTLKQPLQLFTGERLKKEKFWALKDVSFDIKPGDVVGIIGRNGSGKSTLLKVLSRIAEPSSGQATMYGKVASLLEVGTGFHPELTGRENIFFNGAILGMTQKEIQSKFDAIVEFAEVEQFLDTPVKFYSSGMYVRLAFAIAAQLEPDILIVDEVLAVGDAAFQRKSLGRMSDISKAGRTVLFVSHSMGSIRDLCTKGVVMDKGHATYYDNIQDAITAYQEQGKAAAGTELSITPPGKPITFSNFTVNDQACEAEPTIFSGDPMKLELDYETTLEGAELHIGWGLRSRQDGSLLVYTHSGLEKARHETKKSGHLTTTLLVPKFAPGQYSLEFTVWHNKNHCVDSREISTITLTPIPAFANKETLAVFPSTLLVDSTWEYRS